MASSSSNPRRRNLSNDESFAENVANNLQLLSSLDTEAEKEASPDASQSASDLKRMLSLRSVVSTTSSNAQRHVAAQLHNDQSFQKIGAGACGIIFSQTGKSLVFKLARAGYNADLFNDGKCHAAIQAKFKAYGIDEIKVPACYSFVPSDDPIFFEIHPGLVEAAQSACNVPTCVFATERIWPLPESTRTLLIERYCADRNKEKALADPANRDCLVRPYLGSSRGRSGGQFFSLRNFKMHLNQMMEIQLDVVALAHRMAVAMAIMHWAAKTDARDVEFVIGSSTPKGPCPEEFLKAMNQTAPQYVGPESRRGEDFFHRTTELWLLDFNQVRPITLDAGSGVAQAVEAVTINDPYLPKPLQKSAAEIEVWNAFVKRYLLTSHRILANSGYGENDIEFALPGLFLQGLIDVQKGKQRAE